MFFDKKEIPFAAHASVTGASNLRQKFVLINLVESSESDRRHFETTVIKEKLLNRDEVRSIYRIDAEVDGTRFHYWADIVAAPHQTADIVMEINDFCSDLDIEIGTRTMEVLRYYISDSVDGVHMTDFGQDITLFLEETRRVDSNIADERRPDEVGQKLELLQKCASAWYDQSDTILSSTESHSKSRVSAFYAYLYWGNLAPASSEKKESHLRRAGIAWNDLAQHMESLYTQVLTRLMRVGPGEDPTEMAVLKLADAKHDARQIEHIKRNPIELVFQFARSNVALLSATPHELQGYVSQLKTGTTPIRNMTAHADQRVAAFNFDLKKASGRSLTIDDVIRETAGLINLINLATDCLARLESV